MIAAHVKGLDSVLASQVVSDRPAVENVFTHVADRGLLPDLSEGIRVDEYIGSLHAGPTADLFAAFLLRLLGITGVRFETTQARVRAASFLDGTYGERLGPYYTRPRRHDAHEFLSRLAAVAPAIERRTREIIEELIDPSRSATVHTQILRLINGSAGQVLFRPFLPERSASSWLKEVFDAATALHAAEEADAPAAYRRLQTAADGLRLDSQAMGTAYASLLFGRTAERLADAGRRTYEFHRPPARLRFVSRTKPLPLGEPGVTCTVSLAVQNQGEAPADDVSLSIRDDGGRVTAPDGAAMIGQIAPGSEAPLEIPITVMAEADALDLAVETRWTNLDQTTDQAEERIQLESQSVGLDWSRLATQQPFAPYPVEDPARLVGRDEDLQRLVAQFSHPPLDNLFITGQRRVGKTSLVRALVATLAGRETSSLVISQVELGEARHGGSTETIAELGRRLASRLTREVGLFDDIAIPEFSDSLAPLIDVVEAIRDLDNSLSFLFVIDEFDELPHEVYRREGPGDALFLPVRSLAQKPYVGWILVGGENMPFIRDEQAHRLNTFNEIDLGYLALERDFAELIRGPLPQGLSVQDPAIRAVHEGSAGNPHFAKEIAANLFQQAVHRRDSVITAAEVDQAAELTARQQDLELFAHFWEDGIFDVAEERRRTELQRRLYLTAFAELLRSGRPVTRVAVAQLCDATDLPDWNPSRTEAEFVRRHVLSEEAGTLFSTVPLFGRWLESEGVYKLPPRGVAEKAGSELGRRTREAQVKPEEIGRVLERWASFQFQGQPIRRDNIETWLTQFDTFREQRFMFRLLERFRVVSEARERQALRQLQGSIQPKRPIRLDPGQRSLAHILVSYCGPVGGSGPTYSQLYRQANNIRRRKVKAPQDVAGALRSDGEIQAVVLVDDFLGSGQTALSALTQILDTDPALTEIDVDWFVFAVCGLESGANFVEKSGVAKSVAVRAEVAELIQTHDLPFHPRSSVFADPGEREFAEQTARSYGERLWREHPLGLSDGQALVVFPNNCPNNVPPIFWSDKGGWMPLFRRSPVN